MHSKSISDLKGGDVQAIKLKRDMIEAVERLVQRDARFEKLVQQHGVCDYRPWARDPFDSLVSAIVSQQLSTKAARTIANRLREKVQQGRCLKPDQILQLTPVELRACGLSNAKARYVLGIANAVRSKQIRFRSFHRLSDAEIIEHLVHLPGVGVWTAEMFLIFALGRPDVWSYGDLGLRKGLQLFCGLDAIPTPETFTALAEPWRPYRSIASWYLWRITETGVT